MKLLSLARAFILGCSVASAAKSDSKDGEDIVPGEELMGILTNETFDKYIKENPHVLVKFYADWCGHCKHMRPGYGQAALKMKDRVKFAKVNAIEEQELAKKHNIKGFPTLHYFRDGVKLDYDGGRGEEDIVNWLEGMISEAVTTMTSAEITKAIAGVEAKSKPLFIATVSSLESSDVKAFGEVADKNRTSGKFVITEDKSVTTPTLRVVSHGNDFSSSSLEKFAFDTESIAKFVKNEGTPLFGQIDQYTFGMYTKTGKELIWIAAEHEQYNKLKEVGEKVGRALRDDYSLVWLDIVEHASHADNSLVLADVEKPAMSVTIKGKRYNKGGLANASVDDIVNFIKDASAGKIEPTIKSEDIPETNDEPVKVVVAKNLDKMVFHEDKDAMLLVHAPWCPHCKKIAEPYNKLAETLAKSDKIVVAKLDGSANEIPHEGFQYHGFPFLFYVKAGSKTPVAHNGARTLDGFLEFAAENGNPDVKAYIERLTPAPTDKTEKDEL